MKNHLPFLLILISVYSGTSLAGGKNAANVALKGKASYYGENFAGKQTASGEVYDTRSFTAAHPSLPFGTLVHVTNLENQKTVVVRINNRGPFLEDKTRIIDLSLAAAEKIKMIDRGVVSVKIQIKDPPDQPTD